MDIQKEREAFEAYMAEKYKNLMDRRQCLNDGGGYMAWDMNVAWKVWQAAKAQAVPDGFVLVERFKLLQILGSAVAINTNPKTKINLLESDFIIGELKAMIKAQESTND